MSHHTLMYTNKCFIVIKFSVCLIFQTADFENDVLTKVFLNNAGECILKRYLETL